MTADVPEGVKKLVENIVKAHEQNKDFVTQKEVRDLQDNKKIISLLSDKQLFQKIDDEVGKKVTGEENTRKTIILECCKIYVANLQGQGGLMINSDSNAGKSFVTKKVYDLFPDSRKKYRTKISPEAFTYWKPERHNPDFTWDGKLLYLEDISQSLLDSPTFKVMLSEGSEATIVKNQVAIDIYIPGKPFVLLTTAETHPKNEILSRLDSLSLDETEAQTGQVIAKQAQEAERTIEPQYNLVVKEALGYLKQVNVVIPFAKKISKRFPINNLRARRDFSRFLDLVKAATALFQYQRKQTKEGYYIAEAQDYELAKQALTTLKHKNVFGLTHRLKKAYESCCNLVSEKKTEFCKAFTVKEVHAYDPFVSEKMWYYYVNKLCELKLLATRLEKREDDTRTKKPITVYSPVLREVIELPSFSELITINSDITFNSNNTINSNNPINEINEINEYAKADNVVCSKCSNPILDPLYAENGRPVCDACHMVAWKEGRVS